VLETPASNAVALRAYERAGFQRSGTRRSAVMSGGIRRDVVLLQALKDDFRGSTLSRSDD
jgi:RimJ/RimL family protein N-acetyltransferase